MMLTFPEFIEYAGTYVLAISGIRLAAAAKVDLFGAVVIGIVTSVGGGTIRDLLLNATPFWMDDPKYFITILVGTASVVIFRNRLVRLENTFFIFDTIGLGMFTLIGIEKTLLYGHPYWVAMILGMITGIAGGITRDILINEVPLIFRKEIYAGACIIGGLAYALFDKFAITSNWADVACVTTVIVIRTVAIKYQLGLPVIQADQPDESNT
ncbi:trimeric intracellular cation channel family protein [Mangrovivirga cuniculi]|uniref:Trimeric intracellular cation channel family protein n=1 Tax=Mangrovivirga cuniculi TaxID=2715131 RepID=A0A4D7JQI2_9BACT|nr:trimeric intracellular cation channel family protein [Mangrovivirga cuniculi]QCK16917.1 trimeric intracellular cation channel family protein [Mangrovivirga cuniculi]